MSTFLTHNVELSDKRYVQGTETFISVDSNGDRPYLMRYSIRNWRSACTAVISQYAFICQGVRPPRYGNTVSREGFLLTNLEIVLSHDIANALKISACDIACTVVGHIVEYERLDPIDCGLVKPCRLNHFNAVNSITDFFRIDVDPYYWLIAFS